MSLFEFQKSLVETMWRSLLLCVGSSKASSATSSAPQWLVEWWLHVQQQQQQQQQQQHRSLQGGGGAGGHGTLAILIIVSILFCLVWTPTLFRRCGFSSYRDRLEAEQAEAEAIRAVLQAGEHDVFSAAAAAAAAASASSPFGASYYRHHHPGMATASLEDRRNYVGNILITKRVLKCDPSNTKDDDEGQQPKSRNERRKSDLYITVAPPTTTLTATTQDGTGDDANTGRKNEQAIQHDELPKDDDDDDVAADVEKAIPTTTTIPNNSSHYNTNTNHGDNNSNDDDDSGEACPICLNDYAEGDEICWSHNHSCNHVFHRECILEWLLRHEDCPCCRHNFLSVDDNSYPPLAYTTSMHNPIDEQSWGNTNLFWSPLRIPPLPRIDADEEEFWNRIHEFRHFARRYLNGPYPSNGYGASSPTLPTTTSTTNMNPSLNSLSGVTTNNNNNNNNHTLQSEYPPPYLSRSTRAYPSTGLSIFQLEDPSPAYSLAIGRSTNRFSASFGPPAAATTTTTTNVNNNTDSELPSSASGTTTAGGSRSQRLGASAIGANRIGLDEGDDESSSDSSSQSDSSSDRNDRQRGRLPSTHSLQPTANHVPAAAEGGRVENTDRDMEANEQNSTLAEAVPDPQLLVVVARSSNESSSDEVVPSHVVVTIDTRGEADQPETADDDHLEVTDPPAQESDTTHHTSSLNGSSEV